GSVRTIRRLRSIGFIAALDLFYNPRSAMLLFLSGIPIRVGGNRRWRRSLYTETFSVPRDIRSALSHHLFPLGIFGADTSEDLPHMYLRESERDRGAEVIERTVGRYNGNRPIIAFHPGGTWPSKRWAPESFARLAIKLKKQFDAVILIIAGSGEEAIGKAVRDKAGGDVFILPLQPIRTLASVLDHCAAVVANDGGVLHLTVGLGRPVVGIFGPTEPDIWFPYEGKGPFVLVTLNESCAPCHHHYCEDMRCLSGIEPDRVLSKVEELLG
ncbi:MAG: glycosyltransferase family 9 protein, partial [Candidatus Krumholzibacteria bacterium]|nr:glycosyltransferase family 9 protein [Candidatus Krumholzibacteria bacterium]